MFFKNLDKHKSKNINKVNFNDKLHSVSTNLNTLKNEDIIEKKTNLMEVDEIIKENKNYKKNLNEKFKSKLLKSSITISVKTKSTTIIYYSQ